MPSDGKAALLCLLVALGCGGRDPDIRVADLVLRLPRVDDCRPTEEATAIVVQALGDFPPSDENTIDVLRPSSQIQLIERFPSETEIIGVRVTAGTWTGIGARILGDESVIGPLLVVPQGRSCPLLALGDLLEGARVAALPNGGLVMIGGLDGPFGTSRVVRVDPGEREGVVLAPEDAMQFERVGHRLVGLEERVMILGGALSPTDTALDEWEMYDVATGRVIEEDGHMLRRRINHAATRLADGRVLVAGGREQGDNQAIDSVEIIDPSDGSTTETEPLPIARAGHEMVTLDDGTTVLIGGVSNMDAFLPFPVVWDAGTQTLIRSDANPVGLWREGFRLVPLEGGRLVVIGDAFGSQHTGDAVLLRHTGRGFGPPQLELDELNLQIPDLTNVRGTQLDDGRLLVTGRDAMSNPRAFAFRIGPTNAAGETDGDELDASPRVPDELLRMSDGLIVELAGNGASVRREGTLRTYLHNARATVLGEDLALDGPQRWSELGAELIALVPGARADVPTLRFEDVSIQVTIIAGEDDLGVEVLLRPENAAPVGVLIRSSTAGPALCETPRPLEGEVVIERRGTQVRVTTDDGSTTCTLDNLVGRIGIGFRARELGARIRGISIERL